MVFGPCNPLCSLAVLNDAVLERAAILHKKVLGSLTFEVVRGGVGVQAKELGSLSGSGGGPALIEALRKHATEIGAQFLVTVVSVAALEPKNTVCAVWGLCPYHCCLENRGGCAMA